MGPYGAHHTLSCLWSYILCIQQPLYMTYILGFHPFKVSFIDQSVLLFRLRLTTTGITKNWQRLRILTGIETGIKKTGNASIFLQGLKLATPPRPNGLQIPDCLRKDRPMSI